jgi:tyrosine-protein kinase Etk/Wzc
MSGGKVYGSHGLIEAQVQEQPYVSDKGKLKLTRTVRVILLRKGLVLVCALVGFILGIALALWIKPSYTAKATFLPPSSPSASSSLALSQLGQLGVLGGAAGGLGGLKDPGTIYIGILESRTVADDMIRQFDLQRVYGTKKLSSTEKSLAAHTKFIPGKDTLVTISVNDHDPQRAAAMANAYLKALSKQNDRLSLTEAGQRRSFFEQQLEKEKNLLADAEVELAETEQRTGLIHPTGQAQVQLNSIAQTRAAISSRQIELTALSQGATGENPEVIRLNSEIAGLKEQLRRLENSPEKGEAGDPLAPTSRVPGLTLEYVRKEREVKYQEALYELLLRQYESAQLDESRAAPLVQVVDNAVLPDQKSWPPRTLIVLFSAFFGAFAGIGWVTLSDVWKTKMGDPAFGAEWQSIRDAARIRQPNT